MNISKFVKSAVGAAVLAAASLGANASVYNLGGVIMPGFTKSFVALGGGTSLASFSDVINFTLGAGTASTGYDVDALNFQFGGFDFRGTFTDVGLYDSSNIRLNAMVPLSTKSVSVGNFAIGAGAYSLKVSGVIDPGANGYFYTGSVSASSVSPVPEPETYAMLLAGLGLMGAIARRRNKA